MAKTLKDTTQEKRDKFQVADQMIEQNHPNTKSQHHKSDKAPKNRDANRETYYIPKEIHAQLKILAIQQEKSPSDLIEEGARYILKKYGFTQGLRRPGRDHRN